MDPAITLELFTAYVQGTASAAQAASVRAWLAQPASQPVAQLWMRLHWDELDAAPALVADAPDYEALLTTLHEQLHFSQPYRSLAPAAPVAPRWRRWAAAAAVAGTLLGGGSWWLLTHQAAPATQRYATAYGQTRTVRLPDGSSVMLNGHSALRYPAAWAAGQPREVWLDGEGYFAVQHQADNQRFVVHTTAGFNVEVLGTKFTVSRRQDRGRVVLLSGKVRVHFDDHQRPDVLLAPGEMVETREVRPAEPVVMAYRKVRSAAAYASWKDAELVLDETTIAELAARLQDTYGLTVEVDTPELNQRKVTGTLPVRDLDVLLQSLEETLHVKARRQGNHLILTDKNKF